ncbi:MAG: redoxin domain-containing protein [Dehalococcoidia bacterium]|nr:redoxin domain-containing protein [Dehalococcoidia bacterium]
MPPLRANRPRAAALAMAVCLALVLAAGVLSGCSGNNRSGAARDVTDPGANATTPAERKSWAGKEPAPEFRNGLTWFNVERPLTFSDLRGKVVLLDFWTLGCINCQHIVPDLKHLEAEFGDRLAVIGVHSGKYATEHDDESVREAIRRLGLEHAVVNDPDFAIWDDYGANAWPTLVVIDPLGRVVGKHSGEGVYALFQPIIAAMVTEFEDKLDPRPLPLRADATAASSVLSYPGKVLADEGSNRLYIADSGHNRILVATLDGRLERAIGTGKEGFADGAAGEARFRQPQGLGLSADGRTLYVADTRNHAVRAIDLGTFEVTTIAGTGVQAGRFPRAGDLATKTPLASPWDVVEANGSLYITMAGLHQVWALDLAKGTLAVFAGTSREGLNDGDRLRGATLAQPSGITAAAGWLYWVDPEASALRRVALTGSGEVETIVGKGLFDYGADDGRGRAAMFQHAQGVAVANGTLYIGDTYNHRVRAVDAASFAVTTLAGSSRGWSDGTGTDARFDEPAGLSVAAGKLFIADTNNDLVRTYELATGRVATVTLSNLQVANAGSPGRRVEATLPAVTVAPGPGTLKLTIASPSAYHLNSQAPSTLALATSNAAVATPGDREVSWRSDEATVTLPIPADFAPGSATLTATASVYYCRTGEESLCFILNANLVLPIIVDPAATASEARFDYVLPGGS